MGTNMIDLDKLTVEKQYVISAMSNEEVRQMLMRTLTSHISPSKDVGICSDSAPLVNLDGLMKAKLEKHRSMRARLDDRASRWLDMTEKVLTLRYQNPKYAGMDMHETFHVLREKLNNSFLPADFIDNLIPALLAYIVNGELARPVLVVGPAGCGKTTALEIIAEVLGMAYYRFDALTAFSSHGLYLLLFLTAEHKSISHQRKRSVNNLHFQRSYMHLRLQSLYQSFGQYQVPIHPSYQFSFLPLLALRLGGYPQTICPLDLLIESFYMMILDTLSNLEHIKHGESQQG